MNEETYRSFHTSTIQVFLATKTFADVMGQKQTSSCHALSRFLHTESMLGVVKRLQIKSHWTPTSSPSTTVWQLLKGQVTQKVTRRSMPKKNENITATEPRAQM